MSVRGRRWLVVGLVCVVGHAAYLGSYALLVEPVDAGWGRPWEYTVWREPVYRFGGSTAYHLYAPAHWLDRQVRSDLWAVRYYRSADGAVVEEVYRPGLRWPP